MNDLRRGTQPITKHDQLEWAAVPASGHTPHAPGTLLILSILCCFGILQGCHHIASAWSVLAVLSSHMPAALKP